MILADKIINERKKNGWSQEDLAEQLSVSRQSVSKWEGAQAVPDLQKILKMAELFNVSTDYLLKDEMNPEDISTDINERVDRSESKKGCKKVSMEEASTYLSVVEKLKNMKSLAVSLCILSPVILIFFSGLAEDKKYNISENLAAGIGLGVLFLLIVIAVVLFIYCDMKEKPYEYIGKEPIDTEYGVIGMVKEKKKNRETEHFIRMAVGIGLCIVCAVPLIIASLAGASDSIVIGMVCVLLGIVSVGCFFIVGESDVWESYEKLLEENDYSDIGKKRNSVIDRIANAYWCTVTAVFLGWSFYKDAWGKSWIVWPVAGVLFAVIVNIANIFVKEEA